MPTNDSLRTADGLRLHVNVWRPEEPPRLALALVHGVTEHSGRYADLAVELTRHGCAVYGLDLRGHGRSAGRRVAIRRFEQYVDDVEGFLGHVRAREPGRPLFLFGHSMGGGIAAWLAITHRPDVRGLILSAPAVRISDGIYPLLQRLAPLASLAVPWLRIARLGCSMLSRDAEVVREFRNDPLVHHGRMTTRVGAELLRSAARIQARMEEVLLPLVILHGTADAASDSEGSRELFRRAASPDKTLHLYEGLYHDLVHEPEKERVVADIVRWLNRRTNTLG